MNIINIVNVIWKWFNT